MNGFPRVVQDYVERRFDAFDRERRQRFAAIETREEMRAYVEDCRRKLRALYALPEERCDLRTRVTGEIRCDGYRIEKLVFQSRPGFPVTANLYVPDGDGPFPCVLGACGHSNEGKAAELYQSFSAGLASKGFLVLIYDPIGQGERFQYPDHKDVIPGCVAEHITIGNQQYMLGEYFGTWRAWDGVRALDVLLDRPEADPTRVGMTGNSGGRTMTTILTAPADRLTMAAPSCYVTSYRRNLENELPADTEQILPGVIEAGFEEYDHFTAAAPRPTLICTKEDDFFDQRGSREAFEHLKRVYELLGAPDDIEMVTGSGGHGFSQDLREAMYEFFCRHAGVDADPREPELALHEPEELNCTPGGQVAREGSRLVVDFTREKLARARSDREGFKPARLRELLKLEDLPPEPPEYRVLRPLQGRSRIAVATEESVWAVLKYPPPEGAQFRIPPLDRVTLYLPHVDDDEEFEEEPFLREYLDDGDDVFVVSTRGTGESRYGTCGRADYFALYDSDFFYSSYCNMMGFPLSGRKVFDLLRVAQLLRAQGYETFDLAGRGLGAVIALYAAPFMPGLGKVRIKNCIPAFEDMVASDLHRWSHSVLVPDMLLHFDLPDIVDFLRREHDVDIVEPWGAHFPEDRR